MTTRFFAAAVLSAGLFMAPAAFAQDDNTIIVQSTTSTANSGLLDYLLPIVRQKTGVTANVVAVGTGQAIKNAQNCDGDVLLVHSKAAEEKFVEEGHGVERLDLMYNDFVLVGPSGDPAGVAGATDAVASLKAIADRKVPFASRGDDSGTHKAELALWKEAGIDPKSGAGDWYRETGSGMGATLNTAVGMGAYALTDRATWVSFANKGDFKIRVEGDTKLFNQYGVILVSKDKCPQAKAGPGQQFIDFLLSAEGQNTIRAFRVGGEQVFFPNAAQAEMKKAG